MGTAYKILHFTDFRNRRTFRMELVNKTLYSQSLKICIFMAYYSTKIVKI